MSMSRKGGGRWYNNSGYDPTPATRGRHFNNLMEIAAFQAYNSTFLDDNGLELAEEDNIPRRPHCRRSIATSHPAAHRAICPDEETYLEAVDDPNEQYVDYPEDRASGPEEYRRSPLGSSGTVRHSEASTTPTSTPRKCSTTASTPGKCRPLNRADTTVLAPMFAHLEKRFHTAGSRTVLTHTSPTRSTHSRCTPSRDYYGVRKSLPSLVPVRHLPNSAAGLQSFTYLVETPTRPARKPNTAVITPSFRSSAAPLLEKHDTARIVMPSGSPTLELPAPKPPKSPSTFSKASWATLPTVHLPVETLCCIGFTLLLTGAASCILCFYILTLTGRKYFLDFGAISGFTSFILGLLSFRTNKWKWLPHRNYLTGFLILALFSVISCGCLGGILCAVLTKNSSLMDTLGGVVCGLCALVTVGSLLGLVTSGCCHRPPPDNRVAHQVTGFTV